MPPKALTGSQARARAVGLGQGRRRGATPQGLACLMMATAGRLELGDQLEGGVGVVQVVVAERLALALFGGGDARAGLDRAAIGPVEGGGLVRVLAVAQALAPAAGERQARREGSPFCWASSRRSPSRRPRCGHRPRRPGVGARRSEVAPALRRSAPRPGRRSRRVGHHGDEAVVLGRRRADQGRPADVDVLDAGARSRRQRPGSRERGRG